MSMKRHLLLPLALLMTGITAQATIENVPWPRVPDDAKIEFRTRNDQLRSQRETAEEIDIRLKVDYDHQKYVYMQVLCINEPSAFVIDEVNLGSDGYLHFTDIPGEYQFIASFTNIDHNGHTFVIMENVNVTDSTPIVIDANTATNKIHFSSVTPSGEEMRGHTDENGKVIDEGNVISGLIFTQLYHERYGQITVRYGSYGTILEDGKAKYGTDEADIYINELGPDTEFSAVQVRIGRCREGAFAVELEADGMGTQTVTNTADSYVKTSHKFAEHPFGCEIMREDPAVLATESFGFMPIWDGIILQEDILGTPYRVEIDNPGEFYISYGINNNPKFDMLPFFGSYDSIDAGDMGFGIVTPPMRVNPDGSVKYLHNAAVNGYSRDEWTHSQDSSITTPDEFSDYLSFNPDVNSEITWGNSAPLCVASVGYVKNGESQLRFSFVGRNGEVRSIDNRNCDFKMTANGQVISTQIWRAEYNFATMLYDGDLASTEAEYKITINDDNVLVDGLKGYNKTSIYYDSNLSLPNPPSIRSLQFRDTEGNVTDRFSSFDNAIMEFYAGDFEYAREDWGHWWFRYVDLSDVTVEYAPYGTSEWHTLNATQIPEMLKETGYGALYRVQLSDVEVASKTGWYDIRIKLTDYSDNYQIQEISPAFKLEEVHKVQLDVSYDLSEKQELNGLFAYESTGTDTKTYYGFS